MVVGFKLRALQEIRFLLLPFPKEELEWAALSFSQAALELHQRQLILSKEAFVLLLAHKHLETPREAESFKEHSELLHSLKFLVEVILHVLTQVRRLEYKFFLQSLG